MNWCKLGFHKWIDGKIQRTKNICYGMAGCEMPGLRLHQKCSQCPKERYIKLNLSMPDKELYKEGIWEDE